MDPSLNVIFPTKHVIPKSLKFSHWLSKKETIHFGVPLFLETPIYSNQFQSSIYIGSTPQPRCQGQMKVQFGNPGS